MNDLISVIVPIYKVEKYLKKCIDSIITQTYKNLEIILVDDGSPDNCGKICDEYAKQDNRIKVIHKENGGLSDARNKGIDISSGKYLTFVDSDDFIHPECCEKMLKNMGESQILQVSMCSVTPLRTININRISDKINIYGMQEIINIYYGEKKIITPMACGKLYKRELFSHIRFPKGRIFEDASVVHKILENCNQISLIPDSLYYWRENKNSITHIFNRQFYVDSIKMCQEQAEYYLKKNPQLGKKLYKSLFENYIQICVEIFATKHSAKVDILTMLKNDINKIEYASLEQSQMECIIAILEQKENKIIKNLIFTYKRNKFIKNSKVVIKNILSLFIRNKDFYGGL